MKADSLMIGDYVMTSRNEVIKVESISTKRQHRKVGYHHSGDICHIKYVRQGQIEPIPLTEEILKKNGYVENKGAWWLKSDLFTLNEFIKGGYCSSAFHEQVIINYVHELQHALRLCGLNDMADNFKIE